MLSDRFIYIVNKNGNVRHFVLPLRIIALELIFQRAARKVKRKLRYLILIKVLNYLIILCFA